MNNKSIVVIVAIIAGILIGSMGYFLGIKKANRTTTPTATIEAVNEPKTAAPVVATEPVNEPANNQSGKINNSTYLISKEDKSKFCDGAIMNSEEYRKTINIEMNSGIPSNTPTESGLVKKIAVLATDGACQEALKRTNFTVKNGKVEIAPIEGWAGISIAMCSCKPQVEVNLLRLSGITQVIWLSN